MDAETMDRLKRCLQMAFPEISMEDIENASSSTVAEWDSLRAVTLVALIEEELKIQFDLDEITAFTSFKQIHDCAVRKLPGPSCA